MSLLDVAFEGSPLSRPSRTAASTQPTACAGRSGSGVSEFDSRRRSLPAASASTTASSRL